MIFASFALSFLVHALEFSSVNQKSSHQKVDKVYSMNSILSPSSSMLRLPFRHPSTRHQLQSLYFSNNSCNHCRANFISSHFLPFSFKLQHSLRTSHSSIAATLSSDEGPVSVMNFEEFPEKDWSFLDPDELNSNDEHNLKISRIISAGGMKEHSRVLVSIASEGFVDQLVETKPCNFLLVVHDSLFLLAVIKEKYDKVKCWQGELIHVPEKWAPFDVVFLYFLPALPFSLDQIFGALAKLCSPGARLVISHPQGREMLEQQRKQYADVLVSDLPDRMTLQKVAADHSFEVTEFMDEPALYLAILRLCKVKT